MLLLLDKFDSFSWQLQYSLFYEEVDFRTIVLDHTGFLPPDTISPLSWLCGFGKQKNPKRLSDFKLNDDQELGESTTNGVEILDFSNRKIGYITFLDSKFKTIEKVSWFDQLGIITTTEYYCQEGYVYAIDNYFDGELLEVIYLNELGELVGIHNQEDNFFLAESGILFDTKIDFIYYFLKNNGLRKEDIIIHRGEFASSAIVNRLDNPIKQVTMVQELDSLKMLLSIQKKNETLIIPYRHVYERLIQDIGNNQNVLYAPLHYQSKENIGKHTDILVTTMTDRLERFEELIQRNPWATFHLVAPTEFSNKIQTLANQYKNLHLYPSISDSQSDRFFAENKIFLDISWGKTIYDAPMKAFEHKMLMLGFNGTSTGQNIPPESIFSSSEDSIFNVLSYIKKNPQKLDLLIKDQQILVGRAEHDSECWKF